MNSPLVSIACLTFNHENYIRETLDSFLMQKTSFDFEIVVGDGGSLDNNRKILTEYSQKYPSKFKLVFPSKDPGIIGMLNEIFHNCSGKYVAVCEGDDFWLDANKLQTQVDFLENNKDFGLVYGDISFINYNGDTINPNEAYYSISNNYKSGNSFTDLLKSNFIYTPTVCFRRGLLNTTELVNRKQWYLFDYWYWLEIARKSKIQYFDNKWAVYRQHEGGVTNITNFFVMRYPLVRIDIISRYIIESEINEMTLYQKTELYNQLYALFRTNIKLTYPLLRSLLIKRRVLLYFSLFLIKKSKKIFSKKSKK